MSNVELVIAPAVMIAGTLIIAVCFFYLHDLWHARKTKKEEQKTMTQRELFRRRNGYSVYFVPYSVSDTGVKVEYHGPQSEIVKKGTVWSFTVEHEQMQDFQADMREALAKRQRVSFPREQP